MYLQRIHCEKCHAAIRCAKREFGSKNRHGKKNRSIDEKWWLLLILWRFIHISSSQTATINPLKIVIVWNMSSMKRKGKNLTKKNVNRLETEPKKMCSAIERIATVPYSHSWIRNRWFFFFFCYWHWFRRPSTASWRWCFYLWIAFIVGLSIPSHFRAFVIFFNAKCRFLS